MDDTHIAPLFWNLYQFTHITFPIYFRVYDRCSEAIRWVFRGKEKQREKQLSPQPRIRSALAFLCKFHARKIAATKIGHAPLSRSLGRGLFSSAKFRVRDRKKYNFRKIGYFGWSPRRLLHTLAAKMLTRCRGLPYSQIRHSYHF